MSHFLSFFHSTISCPIARKRRLQEESEQNHSPSKRKSHPLKLAMDGCFNAENEGSSEEIEVKEEDEEEGSESLQQYRNEEHAGEEEQEARSSSTNEGEAGDEGECLKCNSHVPHFCEIQESSSTLTSKRINY